MTSLIPLMILHHNARMPGTLMSLSEKVHMESCMPPGIFVFSSTHLQERKVSSFTKKISAFYYMCLVSVLPSTKVGVFSRVWKMKEQLLGGCDFTLQPHRRQRFMPMQMWEVQGPRKGGQGARKSYWVDKRKGDCMRVIRLKIPVLHMLLVCFYHYCFPLKVSVKRFKQIQSLIREANFKFRVLLSISCLLNATKHFLSFPNCC